MPKQKDNYCDLDGSNHNTYVKIQTWQTQVDSGVEVESDVEFTHDPPRYSSSMHFWLQSLISPHGPIGMIVLICTFVREATSAVENISFSAGRPWMVEKLKQNHCFFQETDSFVKNWSFGK